jgi:CheY-like chemotaxis protein
MRVALPHPIAPPLPIVKPPPALEPGRTLGNGRLVLLIDDEPLVRAATAASLRQLGLRVCDAGDGESGLGLFSAFDHELAGVVLDMVMPGLRGRDVLRSIRERRPDLPVVLITGSADTAEIEEIRALGVARVLPKPYDDKELAAALEQAGVL